MMNGGRRYDNYQFYYKLKMYFRQQIY